MRGTNAGILTAPFIVAPLAEQKVIADKLDALLAQVETIKVRLESVPELLKTFRQSVLTDAVSGKLTNTDFEKEIFKLDSEEWYVPKSWQRVNLHELINTCKPICYGVVQPGDEVVDGKLLIRVCDIYEGEVDYSNLRTISPEVDKQYLRSKVSVGDILVTIVGAIGRIGIVREDIEANIARAVAKISPNFKLVLPMYLHIWLSSPVLQSWLVNSSKEVARKTLNLKELKEAPVALPSLDEQAEIVRHVEQLFTFADNIEQKANSALVRVNNLTQSILAKAFRGEFTTNWRSAHPELISGENSANTLLEKIKADRESIKRQPKPKRPTVKKMTGSHMSKQRIKVVEALKQTGEPLSGQQLLAAAGYPSDTSTDQLEQFFLDLRDALTIEKSIVKLERGDDSQDWFALATPSINKVKD
ncbi:restriction endonuclease subunit S [Serratia plymuthica]|uniref:restriction endonuclease subunit S n=1 Tax=Serratia plymuthica TaxID=82996 RepID=UPI001F52CAA6|nr:restriction endonuclease subunit S [Serratia plymuthica]UNK27469.1 restriction endonuclease subunit S [Serratia plymuthica]